MITQGKWEIDEYGILNADGMELGTVYFNDVDEDSLAESEANARLIAAAPELLKALKGLTEDDLFSTKYMDMAREAIAKAEGK